MLKVGLTGGIGSGKSTVSNFFRGKGIKIIDADLISKEVLVLYPLLLEQIKNGFGEAFFDENGELKRKELGNYIFSEEKRKRRLESIMMPFILKEIYKKMEEAEKEGEAIVILDAPTLIEQDLQKEMDFNILVWADEETQIKRVKERDQLNEAEIKNRIHAQLSMEEKKKHVDFVIDNSGSFQHSIMQIEKILFLMKGIRGENEA